MNYDRLANEYAQHRQVHPEALRMLLTQGALDASAKVLEVGCGTGNYSRALQKRLVALVGELIHRRRCWHTRAAKAIR